MFWNTPTQEIKEPISAKMELIFLRLTWKISGSDLKEQKRLQYESEIKNYLCWSEDDVCISVVEHVSEIRLRYMVSHTS